MPQSRVSVEEMQVARGGKCSKKGGGVWCAAGGPRKGISTLTDCVHVVCIM